MSARKREGTECEDLSRGRGKTLAAEGSAITQTVGCGWQPKNGREHIWVGWKQRGGETERVPSRWSGCSQETYLTTRDSLLGQPIQESGTQGKESAHIPLVGYHARPKPREGGKEVVGPRLGPNVTGYNFFQMMGVWAWIGRHRFERIPVAKGASEGGGKGGSGLLISVTHQKLGLGCLNQRFWGGEKNAKEGGGQPK